MASKRRNMFYENKKLETTKTGPFRGPQSTASGIFLPVVDSLISRENSVFVPVIPERPCGERFPRPPYSKRIWRIKNDPHEIFNEALIRRGGCSLEKRIMESGAMVPTIKHERPHKYPDIASSDPKERILARRRRIQLRLAAKKGNMEAASLLPKGPMDEYNEINKPIPAQVESSMSKLLQLQDDGTEIVTNVQVAAIKQESERQEDIRMKNIQRLEMVGSEAQNSAEKLEEISSQWEVIDKLNDPLDIYDATERQRRISFVCIKETQYKFNLCCMVAKCLELYASKDTLIESLRNELTKLDLKFNQELAYQEETLNTLVDRIDEQVKIMRRAYRTELDLLEAAIDAEREEILKKQVDEWDMVTQDLEEIQASMSIQTYALHEEYNKLFDKAIIEQQDIFSERKTELMKAFHAMEVERQSMKSLCMLNTEKLNYNYDLLRKRDEENQIIKSQQKRMITKLQDTLTKLKRQISEEDSSMAKEVGKLTGEIFSLHNNLELTEIKANHFAICNCEKYLSLWDYNQNRADLLIKEILNADRIFYEQQLGLDWSPPAKVSFNREDLPSFKEGLRLVKETTKPPERQKAFYWHPFEGKPGYVRDKIMRAIFESLSDNTGFLAEEKLKALIEPFSDREKMLVELDNIFNALGIKEVEGIQLMANYFIPYAQCEQCEQCTQGEEVTEHPVSGADRQETTADEVIRMWQNCRTETADLVEPRDSSTSDDLNYDIFEKISTSIQNRFEVMDSVVSSELRQRDENVAPIEKLQPGAVQASSIKGEVIAKTGDTELIFSVCTEPDHRPSIHPIYVLKALREFMEDFYAEKTEAEDESLEKKMSKRRLTVSRVISDEDVEGFWAKYRSIMTEKREQVWDSLLNGLKTYFSVLKERHNLNEEVKRLKIVNNDMRLLLQNYIKQPNSAKVRNDLMSHMPEICEGQNN
ncbi:hypothetical protein AAG570_003546 [Ranatra chinensis]|uniref:Dynein regulatory complex protein 1 n=1 Tax=Ranatra chinensis TaxID=642074 RepID=A0ABD0Y3X9_9HEMI